MITEKLDRFINNEERVNYRNYSLKSILKLLSLNGDPHDKINTIHIAGTNGKGSVAHAIAAIFTMAGYKTGLYTSPHLLKVNERISINGAAISDEVIERYTDELIQTLLKSRGIKPTYFDILTLFAFNYFFEQGVTLAVIETGLGGRLDSTNVVTPLCSIITDVDYDHMSILGADLAAITREKAGIIKKGIPVVTSNGSSPQYEILFEEADRKRSPLYVFDRNYYAGGIKICRKNIHFDYRCDKMLPLKEIKNIVLPSMPRFQVRNFSMAVTASLVLADRYPNINGKIIRKALRTVTVPGRFMELHRRPRVVFDPAHNYRAVISVVGELTSENNDKRAVIVLSMMKDKDYSGVIDWLLLNKHDIVYYNLPGERSFRIDESTALKKAIQSVSTIVELHQELLKRNNAGCILFTGSFRLFSTAREYAMYLQMKG